MRIGSEFLDTQQYTEASIADYESVWGSGFVSPGGAEKARELIATLELTPDARVLDVCCGLGGSAFLMADEWRALVDGVDLSANMVNQAQRLCRARGLQDRVQISQADCLDLEAVETYDAVYSRDAFLHISDKARLFAVLFRALKPGGHLLLTDYASAPPPWSEVFTEYVTARGYTLHTVEEYAALVEEAGFCQVRGQDLTPEFISTLESDLARIEKQGRSDLRAAWEAKLARARAGEQRWCLVSASRAASDP